MGHIIDEFQEAGFGFVVALLAALSLPLPGVSVPFGLAIAAGALQMILGLRRPWVPPFIRRYRVSVRTLLWIEGGLYRWTLRLERVVRPRFELLTRGPFWNLCGVGMLLMAVGLMLVIPLSNILFVIPLMIYAIGLLESDGLLVLLGHAAVAIELVLAVWLGDIVINAIQLGFERGADLFGTLSLLSFA